MLQIWYVDNDVKRETKRHQQQGRRLIISSMIKKLDGFHFQLHITFWSPFAKLGTAYAIGTQRMSCMEKKQQINQDINQKNLMHDSPILEEHKRTEWNAHLYIHLHNQIYRSDNPTEKTMLKTQSACYT